MVRPVKALVLPVLFEWDVMGSVMFKNVNRLIAVRLDDCSLFWNAIGSHDAELSIMDTSI